MGAPSALHRPFPRPLVDFLPPLSFILLVPSPHPLVVRYCQQIVRIQGSSHPIPPVHLPRSYRILHNSHSLPVSHSMKRYADQPYGTQTAAAPKRHRTTRSGHSIDASVPTPAVDTLPEPGRSPDTTPGDGKQQNSEPVTSSKSKAPPPPFTEVDSVRMQAEPFRLATAELPIDLVRCLWSHGINRELDRNHVNHLYRAFS